MKLSLSYASVAFSLVFFACGEQTENPKKSSKQNGETTVAAQSQTSADQAQPSADQVQANAAANDSETFQATSALSLTDLPKETNLVKVIVTKGEYKDSFVFDAEKAEEIELKNLPTGKVKIDIVVLNDAEEILLKGSSTAVLEANVVKPLDIALSSMEGAVKISTHIEKPSFNSEVCFLDKPIENLYIKVSGEILPKSRVEVGDYENVKGESDAKTLSIKLSEDKAFEKVEVQSKRVGGFFGKLKSTNKFKATLKTKESGLTLRDLNQITIAKEGFSFDIEEKCEGKGFFGIVSKKCVRKAQEICETKGGFLGIGKKTVCKSNVEESNAYQVKSITVIINEKPVLVKEIGKGTLNHRNKSISISAEELKANPYFQKVLSSKGCAN